MSLISANWWKGRNRREVDREQRSANQHFGSATCNTDANLERWRVMKRQHRSVARSVRNSMAVTGYLGLPAEMANIHLRPPTHSVARASASARECAFARSLARIALLSSILYPMSVLDTYLLRLIIVIYAPTTNVTSLIRSS